MKPLALLATAAAAVVGLAGCSHAAAPSAAHVTRRAVVHPASLVNCPKEYNAWKKGPAGKLTGTLNSVTQASSAGDTSALAAALKKAGPAVVTAARYPMPTCADPKGYWTALMMHVNAAASSLRSEPGSTSARLALRGMGKLEHDLSAELKTTVGVR
jgi:hypothetical protein